MKFLKLKKAADKEYFIHYLSEKEREIDSDPHTYKVLKDKKQAIELAKNLFKKMNYEGLVTVDSGDYSYYSTDDYDWDKITKFNSKDYKKGYKDGKDDYEIGHPMDPNDFNEKYSQEYIDGYWEGFNDAQEKEFMKQSADYYKFRNDLPEYQPSDIKVGQEVWFNTDEVTNNENNLDIVKEIEDHGIVKEIKKWPYGNREYYMVEVNDGIIVEAGTVYDSEEKRDLAKNRPFSEKFEPISKESAIQQPNKPKPTTMLPDNMQWAWDPDAADWVAVLKDNDNTTPPLYDPNNQNVVNQTTNYMSTVKSSCLSKFLDGPRYSKEIKIEAGLIKNGLVKYAGFDFNRGTKYAITDKGLEVLRKASEAEHNEALNEREKLAYMFGFNTDKETTLDTTGKVIKQSARKWTICEADGTELGEVEADSELDAKVKFGIEHPEYADSQSICAKEVKAANKPFESTMGFYTYEVLWQDHDDKDGEFIEPIRFELCDDRDIDEWSWKCEELFGKEWFYGFLSRKDAMDKVIEELNKWGTIKGEIKQVDSLYTGRLKRLHSNYEQTINTKEPYPNPSETPHDDIILENHTGWVNTADQKVTQEFAKLHELLGKYIANDLIQLSELDGNLVASGDPQVINTLEHEVKDIGYYCEAVDEYTDSDYAETYSLKIFMK